MATISDVATSAGVSTATVSRALNGKTTVDPDLAQRVLAAAAALDYRPNRHARNLRRQEAAVITLVISDVANPFFTAITRGVEDIAHAAGYSVVLCNSDDDPAKEREYLDVALQERVAGVLVSPSGQHAPTEALVGSETPVVAVDRPLPRTRGDAVLVASRSAANDATAHLAEQGYRRIGCVTGPTGVSTAEERLAGYREAVRAAKLSSSAGLVRRAEFNGSGARQAAHALLTRREPPDALLVANNAMVVGVLQALRDLELRPGTDVGLVAFDDAPWAELLAVPLSVVTQPAYEMGTIAARLLLRRIADASSESTTTTLSAQLMPRASSTRR